MHIFSFEPGGRKQQLGADVLRWQIVYGKRVPTQCFLFFPMEKSKSSVENRDGVLRNGGGHGNPLQYSCLENPHRQRSLCATVQGVTESDTTE